jgi:hypothetical protein
VPHEKAAIIIVPVLDSLQWLPFRSWQFAVEDFAGSMSELSPVRSMTRELIDFISQPTPSIDARCCQKSYRSRGGKQWKTPSQQTRPVNPCSQSYSLSHDQPAIPKGNSGVANPSSFYIFWPNSLCVMTSQPRCVRMSEPRSSFLGSNHWKDPFVCFGD